MYPPFLLTIANLYSILRLSEVVMKKAKELTNKELLSELKNRLHHPNTTGNVFAEDRIYAGFMKRADTRFEWFAKTGSGLILNCSPMVEYLYALSGLCTKVDSSKNILSSIEDVLLNLGCNPPFEPYNQIEGPHVKIAKALVDKQVKRYAKEAFKTGQFDMSATKLADMGDVLNLAQAIYVGNLQKAKKSSDFDTCVREDIPASAWNWMQKNL